MEIMCDGCTGERRASCIMRFDSAIAGIKAAAFRAHVQFGETPEALEYVADRRTDVIEELEEGLGKIGCTLSVEAAAMKVNLRLAESPMTL